MRFSLSISMAVLAFTAAGAAAETVQPNHLDCRFDEGVQSIICPDVLPSGRAAAEPVVTAVSASSDPVKGSPEWNARCAAKYKSFDSATGMYKSYSGVEKPCR